MSALAYSEEVLSRIRGRDLVEQQIGHWPDFEDFEVVSITLDRPPCGDSAGADLRAVFYIFNINHIPSTPERRPDLAEIMFHDIDELSIEQFNHQNQLTAPMLMNVVHCPRLQRDMIRVSWDSVSFRCLTLTVVRVTDLDPFRYGSPWDQRQP